MLASIIKIIKQQLTKYEPIIVLEEFEQLGDSKIEVTISTPHLMGSIEILKELVTDLLIVEFDNEKIIYSKTLGSVSNMDELIIILSEYFCRMVDIEKKYEK